MERVRGGKIAMIFQDPSSSLNPVFTVGGQIERVIRQHLQLDRNATHRRAEDSLAAVGLPDVKRIMSSYPHQLSGGQQQRVMIAMALTCLPDLLIADEPTTALDVTVQAQILELIKELQQALGMSVLYITHDLGVIAEIADEVAVMYLGRVVEQGTAHDIFKDPLHPYTSLLLKSIPKLGRKARVRLEAIKGTVPMPLNPPWQCGFWSRCPVRIEGRCDVAVPALVPPGGAQGAGGAGHRARCFLRAPDEEPRPADAGPAARRPRLRRVPAVPAAPIEGIGGGQA
jgi:oligopeptide/dipeptide ABC transporter ATP-binding protein